MFEVAGFEECGDRSLGPSRVSSVVVRTESGGHKCPPLRKKIGGDVRECCLQEMR